MIMVIPFLRSKDSQAGTLSAEGTLPLAKLTQRLDMTSFVSSDPSPNISSFQKSSGISAPWYELLSPA